MGPAGTVRSRRKPRRDGGDLAAPDANGMAGALGGAAHGAGGACGALEVALQQVVRRLLDPRDALCHAVHALLPAHTTTAAVLDFAFGFFQDLRLASLAQVAT